jgi:hypothetical protein
MRAILIPIITALYCIIPSSSFSRVSVESIRPDEPPRPFTLIELFVDLCIQAIPILRESHVYPGNMNSICSKDITFRWYSPIKETYKKADTEFEKVEHFFGIHIFKLNADGDTSLVYTSLNDGLMLQGESFTLFETDSYLENDSTYIWFVSLYTEDMGDSLFNAYPILSISDLEDVNRRVFPNCFNPYYASFQEIDFYLFDWFLYPYLAVFDYRKYTENRPPILTDTKFTRCSCSPSPAWNSEFPRINPCTP